MDDPRGDGAPATAPALPRTAGAEPPLRTGGRAVRLVVTAVCGLLLLAGTAVGQDDAFPFGPFRMYATTDSADRPVASTRMEGVDARGRRFPLRGEQVGLRRAEVEGQLVRFRRDPRLLAAVADAYDARHPDGPALARIDIVVRNLALSGGVPTGAYTDTVMVSWDAADGRR